METVGWAVIYITFFSADYMYLISYVHMCPLPRTSTCFEKSLLQDMMIEPF